MRVGLSIGCQGNKKNFLGFCQNLLIYTRILVIILIVSQGIIPSTVFPPVFQIDFTTLGGICVKAIFTILLAVCCAAVLIAGNLHWKGKIAGFGSEDADASAGAAVDSAGEGKGSSGSLSGEAEILLAKAAGWPEKSVEVFRERLEEGAPFSILIAGSDALGEGEGSWPEMVQSALGEAYGVAVSVEVKAYEMNSMEFVTQGLQEELPAADMVILEPFTLIDNGDGVVLQSLDNLKVITEAVTSRNEDSTFVLQPPHPLYDATYYPLQVEDMKAFAAEQGIAYLDHWSAWPAQDNKDLLSYLSDDQNQPSAEGHKIWAEFVVDYLVKE